MVLWYCFMCVAFPSVCLHTPLFYFSGARMHREYSPGIVSLARDTVWYYGMSYQNPPWRFLAWWYCGACLHFSAIGALFFAYFCDHGPELILGINEEISYCEIIIIISMCEWLWMILITVTHVPLTACVRAPALSLLCGNIRRWFWILADNSTASVSRIRFL